MAEEPINIDPNRVYSIQDVIDELHRVDPEAIVYLDNTPQPEDLCDICGKTGAIAGLKKNLVLHEDCLAELLERQHDYQERSERPDHDVA